MRGGCFHGGGTTLQNGRTASASTIPFLAVYAVLCLAPHAARAQSGLEYDARPVVEDVVRDRFIPARYDRQEIRGVLGRRMKTNLEGRLLRVDERALLAGFHQRPGRHPWIGEHIGKFFHAASNTWAYSGDARLKAMIDRMVRELLATQLDDGYLGTYTDDKRWTSWDVWSHKYDLIGLMAYYRATGEGAALEACRKIGDLLCRTFGDKPGKRDIIRSGTHVGMAATSVLEPMCMLYRYTGEERYLEFCRYIVHSYDQPHGPKVIKSLIETKSVYRTANRKAYEMMSNLVGLLDLYRLTGEDLFMRAAVLAWEDVTSKRLYVTGSTSSGEHFRGDFDLPADERAHVGEGCVTTTWTQLGWHLLRLTGEARYADELERTVHNHLLGAQHPASGEVCYFTPLIGRKPYGPGINCCVSSVPRAISLIPQITWGVLDGGIAVMLYAPGRMTVTLGGPGRTFEVTLVSETEYPRDGSVVLTLRPSRAARFPLFLRVPAWAARFSASAAGASYRGTPGEFLKIDRGWRGGDRVEIRMNMTVEVLPGGKSYPGFVAIRRGPQVLALDSSLNPGVHLRLAAPKTTGPAELELRDASALLPNGWSGRQAYALAGFLGGREVREKELLLVPFADAGQLREEATRLRVWLPDRESIRARDLSLTAFGKESWSRTGNVQGSICDESPDTFRVTFDGKAADEDWYAVEMAEPEAIARVVYCHGRCFHDGGWFDTSGGKPRIEVRRTRRGAWETVASLESYPEATSSRKPRLADGQRFEVRLNGPARAIAIRIVGKPSSGDNPRQAFSSCAELAAYGPSH